MPNHLDILACELANADGPLAGQTILLVEDSRYCGDAVRMMAMRSGARMRRAHDLQTARRHLAAYTPTVLIVDLGLPDGSGGDLLREVTRAPRRIPTVLAISGRDDGGAAALAAGADGFMAKPIPSMAAFQQAVLSGGGGDRVAQTGAAANAPDPLAYCDDLRRAAALLRDDPAVVDFDYLRQFIISVAREAADADLLDAARHLYPPADIGHAASCATLRALIGARLSQHRAL